VDSSPLFSPEELTIHESAKFYYNSGFNVLPVKMEQDKKTKKFSKKPDLTEYAKYHKERMEKWYTGDVHWCNVNAVGIMQSLPNNDGLYLGVIDLDNKGQDSKIGEIHAYFLEQLNPEIKRCMSKTANNGMHLYFYSSKPIEGNTSHHDSTGIEILGGKRFIVVYPSLNYTKPSANDAPVIENYEEMKTALQKTINHFSLENKKTNTNSFPPHSHSPTILSRGQRPAACASSVFSDSAVNVHSLRLCACLKMALGNNLTGSLGHDVRMAIAAELLTNGYSVDVVVECFRGQSDFDVDVSRRQVLSLVGHKPRKCDTLKSYGLCEGVKCKRKREI